MNTKHGITHQGIHPSFEDVVDKALEHRYTHIWAMHDCSLPVPASHDAYSFKALERHGKVATVSVWKRGVGHVSIVFVNNTAWVEGAEPFKDIHPGQLLIACDAIEKTLGVPMAGSPARVGWDLLKHIHPEWIENIPVNLRDLHFTPKAGPDLIWQRPNINELMVGGCVLHKFDKGSAYPAAARSTDIGVGTPVHLEGKEVWVAAQHEKGHPQEVGVWNCHVTSMAIPEFIPFKHIPSGDYWLAGPRIRMLEAAGYSVEPFEGHVFPQRHDVLTKWANVLWNARNATNNPILAKAYKTIANNTIGFTAFRHFEEDEEEKRRPDIRLQVVSRNAEIMFHNIDKVRRLQHEMPVMVYMDAVYYLSRAEDGRAAFPVLMEREGKLGGFKYEGRIEITPDVLDMFERKMSVADRLEVLNKKGWVK